MHGSKFGETCFSPYRQREDVCAHGTHRCAMPALRTAQEMALTAVQSELSSVVSSPVPFALRPCSMTKRVTVTTLVSKAPLSDMMKVEKLWSPAAWSKSCRKNRSFLNAVAKGAEVWGEVWPRGRHCPALCVCGLWEGERGRMKTWLQHHARVKQKKSHYDYNITGHNILLLQL